MRFSILAVLSLSAIATAGTIDTRRSDDADVAGVPRNILDDWHSHHDAAGLDLHGYVYDTETICNDNSWKVAFSFGQLDANSTAFSVDVYSLHDEEPIFTHHSTPELLASYSTDGVAAVDSDTLKFPDFFADFLTQHPIPLPLHSPICSNAAYLFLAMPWRTPRTFSKTMKVLQPEFDDRLNERAAGLVSDLVTAAFVPALQPAAKAETSAAYTGTYSDEATNSTMIILVLEDDPYRDLCSSKSVFFRAVLSRCSFALHVPCRDINGRHTHGDDGDGGKDDDPSQGD
ncbi:Uu.00g099690.m01.CDS01 [Anthostomella pinea]|uniref:Uu.00g099690.m01.CDS01 n=1 Tax=Anthostomella pinea TaxID=933095 RepID=A0AAI8YF86_9PEZI|nr:Uu.00g099690.m01.CDS01 [Anthostomella pinea]